MCSRLEECRFMTVAVTKPDLMSPCQGRMDHHTTNVQNLARQQDVQAFVNTGCNSTPWRDMSSDGRANANADAEKDRERHGKVESKSHAGRAA